MKQITITVNEQQAHIINASLELYTRLLMGQFNFLDSLFISRSNNDFWKDQTRRNAFEYYLNHARKELIPELEPNAYYGIYDSKHIPDSARIAWDIYAQIRHDISWHNNPKGGITVNFDTPDHTQKDVPLPKVEIREVE